MYRWKDGWTDRRNRQFNQERDFRQECLFASPLSFFFNLVVSHSHSVHAEVREQALYVSPLFLPNSDNRLDNKRLHPLSHGTGLSGLSFPFFSSFW